MQVRLHRQHVHHFQQEPALFYPNSSLPARPAPTPWQPESILYVTILSSQRCAMNGTTQHVPSGNWLLPLGRAACRSTQGAVVSTVHTLSPQSRQFLEICSLPFTFLQRPGSAASHTDSGTMHVAEAESSSIVWPKVCPAPPASWTPELRLCPLPAPQPWHWEKHLARMSARNTWSQFIGFMNSPEP